MYRVSMNSELDQVVAYSDNWIAGHCDYQCNGKTLIINHVDVPDRYISQGVGDAMMHCLANYAREQNCIVVPICSYASSWFKKNLTYRDLL